MFKGKTFYHSHIRKAVAAFGTIFNNIVIERKDSNGTVVQSLRVPLAYATKQKFLSRIEGQPNLTDQETAIVLPRMGFEITNLQYDPQRRVSPIHAHKKSGDSAVSVKKVFTSTPYDLGMQLYIFAKNQEDGLQILEQILPFFNPDFSITVNDLPDMNIKRDIKITLDSVSYEDNTQGAFADRQSIVWSLQFNMKLNFYGHIGNQDIIRKAIVDVFQNASLTGHRSRQTYSVAAATATGTAVLSSNTVDSITVTYKGEGYSEAGPNITISESPTNGEVTAASVTTTGVGHINGDTYTTTGGSGTGFEITATSSGGLVSFTIADGGSGYEVGDVVSTVISDPATITITAVSSNNARASATMETDPLNSGKFRVASVTIDDAGDGYTTAPTVTFEAPDDGTQSVDESYRFLEEFDTQYE
jgi:hypothetical protein